MGIKMTNVYLYIIYFFFYSAAGWLGECIYCSIGERRLINRGFLTGPMCPIYGSGTLVLTVCLYHPFKDKLIVVFFLGLLLCDIVEYITSFIMEKLFHARWWDYSNEPFNIKGRICLKHSIYWGVASLAFVKLIHPKIERLFAHIPERFLLPIVIVVLCIFFFDLVNAVRKALDIRKIQMKLQHFAESIEENANHLVSSIEELFTELHIEVEKTSDKITDKRRDMIEQIMNTLTQYEQRLSPKNKEKKHAYRQLYNNPYLMDSMKARLERMKASIEKAKSTLFDSNPDEKN